MLSEFKEKFHTVVDEEAESSETESLEPGELKSPPPETTKPSPAPETPKPKVEPKPIASPPSPLISLANKNFTKGIVTLPIVGSCTEKYESLFHGSQTIYKIAPDLPAPVAIPAPQTQTSESETPSKKKADVSNEKEKNVSSKKTPADSRTRSKSREKNKRRRSGSIIKGSGGFIRKGKFKLIPMDNYRGRGRNNRGGRGGISRHPSSRFRPATAQE